MRQLVLTLLFAAGPLCAAQADNTVYAKQFPGSTVGEKVAAAQASCKPDTAIPCIIVLDPSLATSPTGTIPALCPRCSLMDNRSGAPNGGSPQLLAPRTSGMNSVNPPPSSLPDGFSNIFAAKPEYGNFTAYASPPASGWGTQSNHFSFTRIHNSRPGFNRGNQDVGQQGWTTARASTGFFTSNTPGVIEYGYHTLTHPGTGDTVNSYLYTFCSNGTTGRSDEGCKGIGNNTGEDDMTYQGSITSGGPGATSVVTKCASDCGNQGDGRYLIDLANSAITGYVTGFTNGSGSDGETPGTFSISSTVPVSNAWGRLASDVSTPLGSPAGITYTTETFNVNVDSKAGFVPSVAGASGTPPTLHVSQDSFTSRHLLNRSVL